MTRPTNQEGQLSDFLKATITVLAECAIRSYMTQLAKQSKYPEQAAGFSLFDELSHWPTKAQITFSFYNLLKSSKALTGNRFISEKQFYDLAMTVIATTDILVHGALDEGSKTIMQQGFEVGEEIGTLIAKWHSYICDETTSLMVDYTQDLRTLLLGCESPLEVAFLVGYVSYVPNLTGLTWLDMRGQYNIEPYRIDFAFPTQKLAIELDGHTYHEKSVDQAVSDRQRDRHLTQQGWKVLRFHRREIEDSMEKCASQVFEFLKEINSLSIG